MCSAEKTNQQWGSRRDAPGLLCCRSANYTLSPCVPSAAWSCAVRGPGCALELKPPWGMWFYVPKEIKMLCPCIRLEGWACVCHDLYPIFRFRTIQPHKLQWKLSWRHRRRTGDVPSQRIVFNIPCFTPNIVISDRITLWRSELAAVCA